MDINCTKFDFLEVASCGHLNNSSGSPHSKPLPPGNVPTFVYHMVPQAIPTRYYTPGFYFAARAQRRPS